MLRKKIKQQTFQRPKHGKNIGYLYKKPHFSKHKFHRVKSEFFENPETAQKPKKFKRKFSLGNNAFQKNKNEKSQQKKKSSFSSQKQRKFAKSKNHQIEIARSHLTTEQRIDQSKSRLDTEAMLYAESSHNNSKNFSKIFSSRAKNKNKKNKRKNNFKSKLFKPHSKSSFLSSRPKFSENFLVHPDKDYEKFMQNLHKVMPGPGQYDQDAKGNWDSEKKPSFSKKGLYGLANRNPRFKKQTRGESPGPGLYGYGEKGVGGRKKNFGRDGVQSDFGKPLGRTKGLHGFGDLGNFIDPETDLATLAGTDEHKKIRITSSNLKSTTFNGRVLHTRRAWSAMDKKLQTKSKMKSKQKKIFFPSLKKFKKGEKILRKALLGPGRYNPDPVQFKTDFNVGSIAFTKKSKRFNYRYNKVPGPSMYRINRSIMPDKPHLQARPTSCFVKSVNKDKSKKLEQLNIKTENVQNLVKNKHLRRKVVGKSKKPGPGHYDAALSKNMVLEHKPLTIEGTQPFQSQVRRFDKDEVKHGKSRALPGPGTYEFESDFKEEKMLICDPAFMSDCPRESFVDGRVVGDGLGGVSAGSE